MTTKLSQKAIREMIDNYLTADVELKKIEKYKEKLKASLIALGEGDHMGNMGQVIISTTETSRLNNDLLKAKFGEALVDCYKASKSVTVRIKLFDEKE